MKVNFTGRLIIYIGHGGGSLQWDSETENDSADFFFPHILVSPLKNSDIVAVSYIACQTTGSFIRIQGMV